METKLFNYYDFFELTDPFATRPIRLDPQQEWLTEEDTIHLFYGESQPPEPVVFKPQTGKHATDVLWTTFPPLLCVSQRLVDLLQVNKFQGWSTYPIEVYDNNDMLIPGYYGFAIGSYAGKQDYERSTVNVKPLVSGAKPSKQYMGMYFDESKKDRCDIFRIQNAVIVLTKRVMQMFKKNKISNVCFTALPEVEIPGAIYDSLKKMRLT